MKVGYDEDRRRLQPGHLAAVMNIRDACADPQLAWYDMLGNSMRLAAYKQRFATDYRTVSRIRLFARTPKGLLLYALYRAKPLARRLRSLVRRRKRRKAERPEGRHRVGPRERHKAAPADRRSPQDSARDRATASGRKQGSSLFAPGRKSCAIRRVSLIVSRAKKAAARCRRLRRLAQHPRR
jgi:hypothetical protein